MVTRGHHRGGMFRGGRSGGFRGGRNSARNSVFIPFQPFDIEHCEHHFPRMETETAEDSKLGEMLLQRNKMLVPNTDTISTFDSMLNQVSCNFFFEFFRIFIFLLGERGPDEADRRKYRN